MKRQPCKRNLLEETSDIHVLAAGREWVLRRPADLESLWEAIASEDDAPEAGFEAELLSGFEHDERLPYWVELWPASIALADWLLLNAERLRGKKCLDLGCGLGLTALVGAGLGAKVIAMDYEKDALDFARLNAGLNSVPQPLWTVMDWRFPAVRQGACDFIWGGDIMYERRFVAPVLNFLEYALAPDGVVWMAEPNRNVYEDFRTALTGRAGLAGRFGGPGRSGGSGLAGSRAWKSGRVYTTQVEPLHVQKSKVSVSLWELS